MVRIVLAVVLTATLFLTGCAGHHRGSSGYSAPPSRYRQYHDCAPAPSQVPKDIHKVPNAVPQIEPKSRYGNPASYTVLRKKYHVLQSSIGYKSRGLASWYGTKFHGYRTSSGERYDMYKMTAAHKTLPLPTYVQVKNLDNSKIVVVKVNDRGPFHDNRLLDLSYAAAAKLGILGKGTGRIEVTALDPKKLPNKNYLLAKKQPETTIDVAPKAKINKTLALNKVNATPPSKVATQDINANIYRYLQVGAFNSKENAEALRQKILRLSDQRNMQVYIQTSSNNKASVFRVRIGPIDDSTLLNNIKNKIIRAKLPMPIALP